MTDKQIMIDGVDVSGCCYFDYENDGYEDSCYIHQNECSAQNCYYKQLKRKEQECSFNTLKIIALQEALEQYETENDQLKRKEEIIEKLKEKYNTICKYCSKSISCDECSNNTTLKILNGEIV